MLLSVQKITLRTSRPAYIIAIGCKNEQSTSSVAANDILELMESSSQDEIDVAREAVKQQSSEASVLAVSRMDVFQTIESEPLT